MLQLRYVQVCKCAKVERMWTWSKTECSIWGTNQQLTKRGTEVLSSSNHEQLSPVFFDTQQLLSEFWITRGQKHLHFNFFSNAKETRAFLHFQNCMYKRPKMPTIWTTKWGYNLDSRIGSRQFPQTREASRSQTFGWEAGAALLSLQNRLVWRQVADSAAEVLKQLIPFGKWHRYFDSFDSCLRRETSNCLQ